MKKLLIILIAGTSLFACTTAEKPLYSWYDTENATYQYTKRGTEDLLNNAMAQYELVINKQNGTRMVPPAASMPSMVSSFARLGRKNRE